MIDLYAIHADFPELLAAEKLRHLPDKRVEFLEQAFVKDIGDQRFVPYIQLHEFEAYRFADPTCFEYFYGHRKKQIAALQLAFSAAGHQPNSSLRSLNNQQKESSDPAIGPSLGDAKRRQGLLQFGNAGVGDGRADDIERLQTPDGREMLQAGVRDLCAVEMESFEAWQAGQVGQAGVRERRAVEKEIMQASQRSKLRGARVGERRLGEPEVLKAGQPLQMHQPDSCDLRAAQIEQMQTSQSCEVR